MFVKFLHDCEKVVNLKYVSVIELKHDGGSRIVFHGDDFESVFVIPEYVSIHGHGLEFDEKETERLFDKVCQSIAEGKRLIDLNYLVDAQTREYGTK